MGMPGKDKADIEVKKKSSPEIRAYLRKHPSCTYDDLIQALNLTGLSKPWFYTLRSQARANGSEAKPQLPNEVKSSGSPLMTVEILEIINSAGFSEELKGHYKTHVLPLLKKMLPGGQSIQLVQIFDPPGIEIRKIIR
jgi:predicted DNA-binding transcriptional regulator AlpA